MIQDPGPRPRLPHLPTELTDLIIDYLACGLNDDLIPQKRSYRPHVLAPLIACSLVSQAFHNRTSHHIFSTIILTESNRSDNNIRKQTISGLIDILDNNCDGDDMLGKRVHTLKLYTAPIRLPAKYAWGEVDENFPTILRDTLLPCVLSKLAWIRSLHLLHHSPKPLQYSDLADNMKMGIEQILRGRCFSHLKLVGFSELPYPFFAHCRSLTDIDYREQASWHAMTTTSTPSREFRSRDYHTLPFNLRHACFRGYNDTVEALIAGGAFSQLKTFTHDLNSVSDIFASSRIICQASSTLETVHINHLNAQRFVEEITDNPIDFGQTSCLREITISSFGRGHPLHALCKFLGTPSGLLAPSTVEAVRIYIRWGSSNLFKHNDPGWDDLDRLLSSSPLFRRLKMVEIRIGVIIDRRDGGADGSQLREAMSQSMNKLLGTLRTTIKLSIFID